MERGGQPGNNNAGKGKPWADALKRALARAGDGDIAQGLNAIADQVVQAAQGGDRDAIQEIGNRLDGKPAQSLDLGNKDGQAIVVATVTPASWTPRSKWIS
jgi:hypothetical protein